MSIVVAYEFRTPKRLEGMLNVLREGTAWDWRERTSDIWDDYLSAVVEPGLIVKVFKELEPFALPEPGDEDRFHLEIKCVSPELREGFTRLTQRLLDQLMPLLEATEIKRTSSYY